MVRQSWQQIVPPQWAVILPFVVQNLHQDRLRARFLECFITAAPEHTQLVGKFLYEGLDPFLWERLVIDAPEMRPRSTPGYTRIW